MEAVGSYMDVGFASDKVCSGGVFGDGIIKRRI